MSTKALQRMIDHCAERADGNEPRFVREARAELAMIERAAVDFTESDSMDEVAIDTVTCFERITNEVIRRTLAVDSSGPSGERP